MSRVDPVRLKVRCAFARARARELAKLVGLTATQVVEDALRGYVPPGTPSETGQLVRRGPLLVRSSEGAAVSLREANAASTGRASAILIAEALLESAFQRGLHSCN